MAPEVVRFRVGDLACMVVCDTSSVLTEEDITNIFPKDSDRMLAAFRTLPAPRTLSSNILCVETGGKWVLVDSGNGLADLAEPGHLLDHLRVENITPESIDTVIISHYHLDHIGGLVDDAGKPTFPTARLVVPQNEHEYRTSKESMAEMAPNRADRLRRTFAAYAARFTPLADTAEIAPGIRYTPALGHTPGHCGVMVESQGARLFHIVDTAHFPMQLNLPDAVPGFDAQPEVAVATRRATIAQAASENLLVQTYHFPFPGLGHIRQVGDHYEWIPYEFTDSVSN